MKAEVKVSEVYYISGIGNVLVGEVISGALYPNMSANVDDLTLEIEAITISRKGVKYAPAGSKAGIQVKVSGDDDLTTKVMGSKYHDKLKTLKGRTIVFEGDGAPPPTQPETRKKKRRSLFGVKRI